MIGETLEPTMEVLCADPLLQLPVTHTRASLCCCSSSHSSSVGCLKWPALNSRGRMSNVTSNARCLNALSFSPPSGYASSRRVRRSILCSRRPSPSLRSAAWRSTPRKRAGLMPQRCSNTSRSRSLICRSGWKPTRRCIESLRT